MSCENGFCGLDNKTISYDRKVLEELKDGTLSNDQKKILEKIYKSIREDFYDSFDLKIIKHGIIAKNSEVRIDISVYYDFFVEVDVIKKEKVITYQTFNEFKSLMNYVSLVLILHPKNV